MVYMNIKLTELVANSEIFEYWEENIRKKFAIGTFYTIFDSPQTWVDYLRRTKRNDLKKLIRGKTIDVREIENNKIWEFIIKDNSRTCLFYIWTSGGIWVVFTEKKSDFNNLFKKIIKYSNGISHGWVSPTQMKEIIDKYVKVGTLQAISKSPYFAIPKRAPIPAKMREELPKVFFKKMSATVQFWAPKEIFYSNDYLTYEELKISRDYLDRILKLIFSTKFDNPGRSTIAVENDSIVSHEKGMPKATEIVFNRVFKLSSLWIDKVKDCIPEFKIKYDAQGEILNLYYKKKPKEAYFTIQEENGFSMEHLIKLEQILISGSKETELVGYRISSDDNTISLRSVYPRFCQDAFVDLILEGNQIKVIAFPSSNAGPHILLQIYRKIYENFAWTITPIEVKDRWT